MSIPLDKEGIKRKEKSSKSKYRLDDSERKLPRPIVFWSDNEKDAFRRNKVVQTRYYMLLDDIETQQKSAQKSIRHEAHKFRRRYKADIICSSDNGSSVELSDITSIQESILKTANKEKVSSSDSGSDSESWVEDVPKSGVITKIRKSNVKFANSDQDISDPNVKHGNQVKASLDINKDQKAMKLRSQSATQERSLKSVSDSSDNRSKSAMMKIGPFSKPDRVDRNEATLMVHKNRSDQARKPNSIFFDRSQAAYELRKELQRLARVRKHGVVKIAFTMEDAIREEKDKLTASSKKVAEYIQKLEIEQYNMKIHEWNTKTIEPVFT